MSSQQSATHAIDISVEPLRREDLNEADRIFHFAFGTFVGLPDPSQFHAGADYIGTRWKADPKAAFAAKASARLIGSNFGTNWGSIGFFGPLTIDPAYWDRGIGKRLMEPIMNLFSQWGTTHAGLFTFAHSQKHVGLYQRFGFWPRFLTAIMSKPVGPTAGSSLQLFSELSQPEREEALKACFELTNEVFEGLDVRGEILSISNQKLGDTIFLWDGSELAGLGCCHCGIGSEAGPDVCYVKFGAARPGPDVATNFERLLGAAESLAARRQLSKLVAGVNTARIEAYQHLQAYGFRTDFQGVAMHQDGKPGYNHAGVYLIDDWR